MDHHRERNEIHTPSVVVSKVRPNFATAQHVRGANANQVTHAMAKATILPINTMAYSCTHSGWFRGWIGISVPPPTLSIYRWRTNTAANNLRFCVLTRLLRDSRCLSAIQRLVLIARSCVFIRIPSSMLLDALRVSPNVALPSDASTYRQLE